MTVEFEFDHNPDIIVRISPLKGGDPAAPSGTATLLRLSPSYQPYLRRLPPEG